MFSVAASMGLCAAITCGIQLPGFMVAYLLQTEVFYDVLGGLNFLAIAAFTFGAGLDGQPSSDLRKVVSTAAFACSRGWLLLFLLWRARERGGDARFDGVKDKWGVFLVFWVVQGVWVFLVSMPQVFISSSPRQELSPLDCVLLSGFCLALVIEIAADVQKAVWVRRGRQGGFCRSGLWSISRHPNYFGEIAQWWCSWALAFGSSRGVADGLWWACALSPLLTMQILLNIRQTGVWNAEGANLKRYYETCREQYQEYRDSTSILIPMVGYRYVPACLKRTVFLDFERYEYRRAHAKRG